MYKLSTFLFPHCILQWRENLRNREGQEEGLKDLTGIHPADRNLLLHGTWLQMAHSVIVSFVIVGGYFLAIDNLVGR
ncbi:hypothetical protein SLA2020_040090 [Shorea laevis]